MIVAQSLRHALARFGEAGRQFSVGQISIHNSVLPERSETAKLKIVTKGPIDRSERLDSVLQAPKIFMLSDMQRQSDWRRSLARQPRHVGLVLRDYHHDTRPQLAAQMAAFCRQEGRAFAIAGDRRLANSLGAAFHCPSFMLPRAVLRGGAGRSCDSAAVHNMAELLAARQAGFGRVFIAPVFATKSHKNARPLALWRALPLLRAARQSGLRAYALGGMNETQWRRLGGRALADGYAAIGAFET